MLHNLDDEVLALARKHGVLRAHDLKEHGIARTYLQRLQRGLLVAIGRGLCPPADTDVIEHQTLTEKDSRSLTRYHILTA